MPGIVGQEGVKRIVVAELFPEEQAALEKSAQTLQKMAEGLI